MLSQSAYKIPKIIIESPAATVSSSATYPEIIITQADALRIFKNIRLLFIGDASIRTLYRDLAKLLANGRLLKNSEAAIQHGDYRSIDGEEQLLSRGSRGMEDYRDIRYFHCTSSSTTLIYVFLPTIIGQAPIDSINFLKTIPDSASINVIIFSSYHSNLNFAKLDNMNTSFDITLKTYEKHLNQVCSYLLKSCSNDDNLKRQLIWMSPYPPKFELTAQVDGYGLRIRSFTTVYGVVYDRIHAIYAPYTTVFRRITWSRITIVYLRGRIRRNTAKYGDRIRSVYSRKRSYFMSCTPVYGRF